MTDSQIEADFKSLGLSEPLLKALDEVGYESPTPIQSQTIPALKSGADVVGQAQTGTGKTAAFALPILDGLDLNQSALQALILVPTRELALQVAEAVHVYSKHLGAVGVLPVYGGQPIQRQTRRLEAGVHVVVGTPGRVMDHLRRGTMSFDRLKIVVLDEADEMLKMGFIEDVEWILEQAQGGFQTALFSATMPPEIRKIADRYLKDPVSVEIKRKEMTVEGIEQRYLNVSVQNKLDTLTRILEIEDGTATLVFTHTKIEAASLTEKLQARGYAAEAMHGDMSQAQRESVIRRLRAGQVEIVVATDVAARGLDVERISHVVNYDIPTDPESYVHRIGRTGRAGREGKAILFVTPRQVRLLHEIERFTRRRIESMKMPTKADIVSRRVERFKESVRKTVSETNLEFYLSVIEELVDEGLDVAEIAAAAAHLARGEREWEFVAEPEPEPQQPVEAGMVRFVLDVGLNHGLRPSDVVGAIANEGKVPGRAIGAIDIFDNFTYVEIPIQFQDQVVRRMNRTRIRNRVMALKPVGSGPEPKPEVRPATLRTPPKPAGKPPRAPFSKPPAERKPRTVEPHKPARPATKAKPKPGSGKPSRLDPLTVLFGGDKPLKRKKKK